MPAFYESGSQIFLTSYVRSTAGMLILIFKPSRMSRLHAENVLRILKPACSREYSQQLFDESVNLNVK